MTLALSIIAAWFPSIIHVKPRPPKPAPKQEAAAMRQAVASWYDAAGGPIACGGDSYAMGVANRTLPCGTRLELCFRRCVQAIVFDRGPYVWPREFDLSQRVANAIGFPNGVATIRWRIAR